MSRANSGKCCSEEEQQDEDMDGEEALTEEQAAEVRARADIEAGEDAHEEGLKPVNIDAYWLQRNVSKAYGSLDENEAVQKAEEIFDILAVRHESLC